jgi:hypothetical protein
MKKSVFEVNDINLNSCCASGYIYVHVFPANEYRAIQIINIPSPPDTHGPPSPPPRPHGLANEPADTPAPGDQLENCPTPRATNQDWKFNNCLN